MAPAKTDPAERVAFAMATSWRLDNRRMSRSQDGEIWGWATHPRMKPLQHRGDRGQRFTSVLAAFFASMVPPRLIWRMRVAFKDGDFTGRLIRG
ncbi:hypothetical protein CYMTET_40823 [Cymbomonas tetramitiformis]|uniref:Uncharacterized protein n=1 Tax=Cymbomonas tetramitiformis TaxID=36881 RepID=A0AAE0C7B7_9CHLO|nr:hypothetical protein CYMTET_40823 [Cymbomonas tetramitiformis]